MDKINKWTKEQLTCPECAAQSVEFVAKDMRGLNGHRMFKHGVHPTAQLPLQKQDLLVSESKLEQLLDERFAVVSEQLDALSALGQGSALMAQLQQQLKDLDERLELSEVDRGLTEAEKEQLDELVSKMGLLTQRIDKIGEQENRNTRMVNENFLGWGNKVYLLFQALDKHTHSKLTGGATMESEAANLIDAEVRVADKHRGELPGPEEPNIIQGKTAKPGYRYMEHLNLSVREK